MQIAWHCLTRHRKQNFRINLTMKLSHVGEWITKRHKGINTTSIWKTFQTICFFLARLAVKSWQEVHIKRIFTKKFLEQVMMARDTVYENNSCFIQTEKNIKRKHCKSANLQLSLIFRNRFRQKWLKIIYPNSISY